MIKKERKKEKNLTKMKIKTFIGLAILLMSIIGYLNLHQLGTYTEIETGSAIPVSTSVKSNDILIDVTKNSTGIGPNSALEFSVELTNNLSESLYDISANFSDISEGLTLDPVVDPLFTVSALDPETSANFQFVTKYTKNTSSSPVDVVLVIDASGSMGDEITDVKTELNDLIANLTADIPDLRMGVIVFGWGVYDEYPTEDTHNYIELTDDFASVKALINSLAATGGREPWVDALYLANTWDWREDAAKLLILIGDEDCDPGIYVGYEFLESDPGGTYNGSDLLNIVTQLKNQEVIISTVICGGASVETVGQFEWIAAYTDGASVYLPDMENEGINLPGIIEEWTLELGREYSLFFNLSVFWKDGLDTPFSNSHIESFWLDFTPPSVIISEAVLPVGIDLYSVEFFIDVDDVSPIGTVTLYHNAYGSLTSELLTPIENTTYFLFTLQDVSGGLNISYFVKSSDILKNTAFTPVFWLIVEPKFDEFGEEVSFWVEADKTIYTNIEIKYTGTYYFILSGPNELDDINANFTHIDTNTSTIPSTTTHFNVSFPYTHKIFEIELSPGNYALTLSIPSSFGNVSVSYVWVELVSQSSSTSYTGYMDEKIRVYGFQWEATNGTYFSFDNPPSSPLVLRGEIYTTNWELVSTILVGGSYRITNDGIYNVLVWATLREGEFTLQLTEDEPTTFTDPYYTAEETTSDYRQANGGNFPDVLFSLFTLGLVVVFIRKRKKK
jgi:Mg-chelatase subunit ChlD